MQLRVLYFGMIAEITNCREEIISVRDGYDVNKLEDFIKNKYQKLQNLSFNIAVDKEILSDKIVLNSTNEIALLPPFSGG